MGSVSIVGKIDRAISSALLTIFEGNQPVTVWIPRKKGQ